MNKKLKKQLLKIQGSSFVMNTKLHNLHWNVKGNAFIPVHQYTETLYNDFFLLYDDAAEKVLQKGSKPLILVEDYVKNSIIKETNKVRFTVNEVFTIILEDIKLFLKLFKKLSKIANKVGDDSIVGFADSNIEKFEKEIWFLTQSVN